MDPKRGEQCTGVKRRQEAVILIVSDNPHTRLAIRARLKRYAFRVAIAALGLGATRCLRKPSRPTTLLGVIDEYLSGAEPNRRHAITLAAAGNALSKPARWGAGRLGERWLVQRFRRGRTVEARIEPQGVT
jgi:hypothetical protein